MCKRKIGCRFHPDGASSAENARWGKFDDHTSIDSLLRARYLAEYQPEALARETVSLANASGWYVNNSLAKPLTRWYDRPRWKKRDCAQVHAVFAL
jgi:hypothetical protein